nr:hypothetical protein [Tanacetum cinerariifolium]
STETALDSSGLRHASRFSSTCLNQKIVWEITFRGDKMIHLLKSGLMAKEYVAKKVTATDAFMPLNNRYIVMYSGRNCYGLFMVASGKLLHQVNMRGYGHYEDKSMWSDQEKRIQKIDHLERSLLIQGLLNDIYSLIDSNNTVKDLWDALARHMLSSKYGKQDRKAAVLYEYETFKATEGELLLNTYI